jgi:hypothetical protein
LLSTIPKPTARGNIAPGSLELQTARICLESRIWMKSSDTYDRNSTTLKTLRFQGHKAFLSLPTTTTITITNLLEKWEGTRG